MKHYLIFIFVAVASLLGTATAQTPMATLEHEGELTVFNGTSAFADAMNVANDGDAIFLAPGRYKAANITKPVSIKGAGMYDLKDEGLYASYIDGNLDISLPEGQGVNIEGVYFLNETHIKSDIKSSLFFHCGFSIIYLRAITENLTLKNCKINNYLQISASPVNMLCQNSSFIHLNDTSDGKASIFFKNCIIERTNYFAGQRLKSATIENCITIFSSTEQKGVKWRNSIIVNSNPPDKKQCENCWFLNESKISEIWDKESSEWKLTKEAAAKYLGTDGTQVGLYGGSQPFTKAVSGPRITKMELPAETDENGRISVTITVGHNE